MEVKASLQNCCDQTCGGFQCPALYQPKAVAGNMGNMQATQANCCAPTCAMFQCRAGTVKKQLNAQTIGASQEVCCRAMAKVCIVYGDPHSESFDGHHNDFYASGEFWIIKSTQFAVQGRFLPTHITRGLSVTKEITIGGTMMQGHILRISSVSVTVDGTAILTTFPGSYHMPNVVDITYNDHGKILQPHRELGKNLKVLHLNFHVHAIFMQVNQWTNPEEGDFINVMVETPPMQGLDGYCGNLNGIEPDDDRINIRQRLGANGVAQGDLIGFRTKTPIETTYKSYPSITSCVSATLMAAHKKCQGEEGHYIPSMGCLARKCANGLDA